MAPVTRASGTKRVVLARHARNQRLADALYQQALAALTGSPGAHAFYDRQRGRGATHHQALRTLANRLVGILHGASPTTPPTTKPPPGQPSGKKPGLPLDKFEAWDIHGEPISVTTIHHAEGPWSARWSRVVEWWRQVGVGIRQGSRRTRSGPGDLVGTASSSSCSLRSQSRRASSGSSIAELASAGI